MRILLLYILAMPVLSVHAAPGGLADCTGLLRSWAGKAKRSYMEMAVKDLSGKVLRVVDPKTGSVSSLQLGEQVGSGCRGSVYRIPPGADGQPRVAKIEKSFKLPTLERHKAIIPESMDRESLVTEVLQQRILEIQKSPLFPKNPSWEAGTFPVVPILEVFESDAGTVLVKPEVVNPKKLKALGLAPDGGLDPKVEKALREIYDLHLAVKDRVSALSTLDAEGMQIDIGTNNLFWVDSAADLKRFHMKRPGFCLFETDQSAAFEGAGSNRVLNPNFNFYPTWESFKMAAIRDIKAL
ncbi:MAG: hypothetical protein EBX52_06100 [Proteobacteria bacterium]|nr:hypothetical protein [Pseudomonadota bacterium]